VEGHLQLSIQFLYFSILVSNINYRNYLKSTQSEQNPSEFWKDFMTLTFLLALPLHTQELYINNYEI
jgi:hypothetical protein